MTDETVNLNNKVRATMRQQTGPLTGSKEGTKVRSPCTTTGNSTGGRGPLNTNTNPSR
jgi:hypothetical protein